MRAVTKYAAAEAAITDVLMRSITRYAAADRGRDNGCAYARGDKIRGGGGRDNGCAYALDNQSARVRIASRRMVIALQLGRELSTRGGSELHLP